MIFVEDSDGAAAENMVTEEEFQEIARLYADIGMGRTDIEIYGTELDDEEDDEEEDGVRIVSGPELELGEEGIAAFRAGVMADLASIMQTESGRLLIDQLANNESGHTTTLLPLLSWQPSAATGTDDSIDDGFRIDEDIPGPGVDSRVSYEPGTDQDLSNIYGPNEAWGPIRSDVVLYHELVHAMDLTYGTLNSDLVGPDGDGVVDVETGEIADANYDIIRAEHRATGLGIYVDEPISENAYREARREIGATNIGEREGDDTMPDRDTYGPAPPPTAGSGG